MTEHVSSRRVAHLRSTRTEHPAAVAGADLARLLAELTADGEGWWLLAEQSDGYVVGRRRPGEQGLALAGSTSLDPGLLFDGRVFSARTELRIAPGRRGVTVWTSTFVEDDSDVPHWARPFIGPLHTDALLADPDCEVEIGDAGFALLRRSNGQETLVPVAATEFTERTRLRIRRHFAWDDETGRVWVEHEALAGYVDDPDVEPQEGPE